MQYNRVLSGMRPTGMLHLGHYHGVLKNWLQLQNKFEAYFFVADWHAFTTHYASKIDLKTNMIAIVTDWLAAGIDPNKATIFIQSKVPEHAELHLLLSMVTPISWLERVPSYKDQQTRMSTKDLSTYGFLGYPLLQSADILIYKANLVPVGEDQEAHVELTRRIARRFNYIFGNGPDFENKMEVIFNKIPKKQVKFYKNLSKTYQETGNNEILIKAQTLLAEQQSISFDEQKILYAYIKGNNNTILVEPKALLTKVAKMTGTDGQKMSKSYNNTILLRDKDSDIDIKIKRMPTDPARVKLTDCGDPNKCPVWQLHKLYSNAEQRDWVIAGCTKAKIGCIECKKLVIHAIQLELAPIKERIKKYEADPDFVQQVILNGNKKARKIATDTMKKVHAAMGITY